MDRAFALSSDEEDEEEESVEMVVEEETKSNAIDEQKALETRFRVELEFVQCLAAPFYLHYLAQHEYLEKPKFLEFLKYLRYWQQPEYARYLEYPDCLDFLDRLCDDESFRRNLKFIEFRNEIDQEQYNRWRAKYHTKNVLESLLPKDEKRHELVEYISVGGKPPPPEFYEKYPHLNREEIERNWKVPPKLSPEEIDELAEPIDDFVIHHASA
ncbi:hypothetical protein CTAYLR_007333 [Chrysophaeum taylorii]|uniref:Mediator of RNA polymerase II transcription subunit 31 n=1 Tax=Chrysophaeum taylorii TaxID=2483200 RepID=A0AAD7UJA8_9STRA|nr:hypothetical protein CTAYLR_007333 [Chrysophaeum taylorii]